MPLTSRQRFSSIMRVGPPLRRALRQRQPTRLLEDRAELAGLDVDGRAIARRDLGKQRAAEIV